MALYLEQMMVLLVVLWLGCCLGTMMDELMESLLGCLKYWALLMYLQMMV